MDGSIHKPNHAIRMEFDVFKLLYIYNVFMSSNIVSFFIKSESDIKAAARQCRNPIAVVPAGHIIKPSLHDLIKSSPIGDCWLSGGLKPLTADRATLFCCDFRLLAVVNMR